MSDFRKLVRFRDRYGHEHRLTAVQWHYLRAAHSAVNFVCGSGGLSSTVTVRMLHQLGLLKLRLNAPGPGVARWEVLGLTSLGYAVYRASVNDAFPRDGIVELPERQN